MGAYVNPETETKESWLVANGEPLAKAPERFDAVPGMLPVCLIDNRIFTAAGICFDDGELEEFSRPDGRPRRWYLAPVTRLLEVSGELRYYLRAGATAAVR